MNLLTEKITEMVKIPQVLSYYGYPEGRHGRIPCPIHKGKDANFCYTNEVYHCWTCGAKGNVITLVMTLFGLNYKQAALKMNTDFNLGLTAKRPTRRDRIQMTENRKIEKAYRRTKQALDRYYKGLSVFHRELTKRIANGESDPELKVMEASLDNWLNENIEGVIQPWLYQNSRKKIS